MKKIAIVAAIALAAFSTSCKKSDNNNGTTNSNGTAQVSMHLTDGPAIYDHIYLDVQQVEVTMNGSAAVTLTPVRQGIYDILQFRNGLDTLLARAAVPAGTVAQIRLILGSNNSIVVNGTSYPLNTPSAQESGLKLNLNQTFTAGGSYDIWLDFDAAKSIVQTGNGSYKLKPVVRAYSAVTNGRIKGYVLPLTAMATVYAIQGTDTMAAIPNTADGYFMFSGLADGTYTIMVDPGVSTLKIYTKTNVAVSYGVVTDLGTITLVP